ncbi:hypothetical protein O181_023246 [Austropuccinia psidii MF-1]|uniref:ATP-dependent RNA helicase n=1 Tax=Austropuccinia psidii MF-1 TaxID=1389203 RepID=A0A9Q3CJ11_9BASI|nr:hypothetical protein [Austropuccinia psidii MF-1]
MFSIQRFDPASTLRKSDSSNSNQPARNEAHLDPLARLNARLEAKNKTKTVLSDSINKTSETHTPSHYLKNDQVEISQADLKPKTPSSIDIDLSQPITKKQKARIGLGLTGANTIPLPSVEGPKPKTKAKLKYLKRKKERSKARKQAISKGNKTSAKSPEETPKDPLIDAEAEQPKIVSDIHDADVIAQSSNLPDQTHSKAQGTDEIKEDSQVESKTKKRPKNLDTVLQRISKKSKKNKDLSCQDSEKVDAMQDALPNDSQVTQPGALPRFPVPINPSLPDPHLLARLAMGLGELDSKQEDEDEDMVQFDNESRLCLSEITLRGESDHFSDSLALSSQSLSKLRALNIHSLLPVQIAVFSHLMPPLSADTQTPLSSLYPVRSPPRDICVSAPTGSGKTLSYIIPIVETLSSRVVPKLRALIVLPTRDLVSQVMSTFESFAKGTGLKAAILTGQHSFSHEQSILSSATDRSNRAVDVVICTPGRLADHLNHTSCFSLRDLCFLVLDEADQLLSKSQSWLHQLLDMSACSSQLTRTNTTFNKSGHQNPQEANSLEVRKPQTTKSWILPLETYNPARSRPFRILLFSATLRRDPTKLANLGLRQPLFLKITRKTDEFVDELNSYTLPTTLQQYMIVTTTSLKPLVFFHLIISKKITSALCFCKSVEGATRLATLYNLMGEGFHLNAHENGHSNKSLGTAACFSSELKPADRKKILAEFQAGNISMLICSDVIARGLDMPSVKHVINYDSPVDARKYVHRVGRTARAGGSGTAWSLVESQEAKYVKDFLQVAMGEAVWCKLQRIRIKHPDVKYLVPAYEAALNELRKQFGRMALNLEST